MPFPMLVWSVALAGAADAATPPTAATHVVTVSQMAFGPPPKVLHAGDTIEWRNDDVVPHTATSQEAGFDTAIEPGGRATTTVTRRGRFEVHCSYHPTMRVTLVVD